MGLALSDDQLELAKRRMAREADRTRPGSAAIVRELAAKYSDGSSFAPDLEAYAYDPSTDLQAKMENELTDSRKRVSMTVSAVAYDGRRENVELTEADTAAYVKMTYPERRALQDGRILERRYRVALAAGEKLAREDRGILGKTTLTPDEEACLREFGGITPKRTRTSPVGTRVKYEQVDRITEGWTTAARGSDPKKLREDFGNRRGYGYDQGDGQSPGFGYANDMLPWGNRSHDYGPMQYTVNLSDVWDEQAKSLAAFRHDPFCKQGIHIRNDFVFGRGVDVVASDERVQAIIDEFDVRHKMRKTLKAWGISCGIKGEIFVRLLRNGSGFLTALKLPAQSIWEIWTQAENTNAPIAYIQRYTTRYQLYNPDTVHYISRELPASDVLHFKINAEDDEIRGRGDAYANLGWHRRLTKFWNATIQKEAAAASYQFDVTLKNATQTQVDSYAKGSIPDGEPEPGGSFVHNDDVAIQVLAPKSGAPSANGSAADGITNVLAVGYGFTKEYFGISGNRTRGGALVASEPSAKAFEERQDDWAQFLDDLYREVIDEAVNCGRLPSNIDRTFKVRFPSIIKADAVQRTELLQVGRENGYISAETAGPVWASEVEIEDYDWGDEQEKIAAEKAKGILPPGQAVLPTGFDNIDPKALPGGGAPVPTLGKPGAAAIPTLSTPATGPKVTKRVMGIPKAGMPSIGAGAKDHPGSMAGANAARADQAKAEAATLAEAMAVLQGVGALVILP